MSQRQRNLFGFDERNKKKRQTVILPVDTLILLSVVVILLLTLSFSIGVEKGRRIITSNKRDDLLKKIEISQSSIVKPQKALKVEKPVIIQPSESIPVALKEETAKEKSKVDLSKKEENKRVRSSKKTAEVIYSIQVATYIKEEIATKEIAKLQEQGYPVSSDKKGKYIIIFVGEFNSTKEAQQTLSSLKKRYKDCFVRRL